METEQKIKYENLKLTLEKLSHDIMILNLNLKATLTDIEEFLEKEEEEWNMESMK